MGLYFMSFSAVTVGYYFHNIPSVYILDALLILFSCFSEIPLFDMLLQHTYPKTPGFVSLTTLSVRYIGMLILGQTSRALLEFINGTAVIHCIHYTVYLYITLYIYTLQYIYALHYITQYIYICCICNKFIFKSELQKNTK